MTREEEIRNAVDTIIPIPPYRDGRTYEQALMATGFEAGAKWAGSHPFGVKEGVGFMPKSNKVKVFFADTVEKVI